jgi:hypothetical protein
MFWIGFAFGVVATVVFLITEHLVGQLNLQKGVAVLKSLSYRAGETSKPVNLARRNRTRKDLGQKCVTYLKSLFFSAGEMPKPINLDRHDPPYTQLTREERDRYWRRGET